MDILMQNIAYAVNSAQVVDAISRIVHGPLFSAYNTQFPLNFKISLHQKRFARSSVCGHDGTGTLTLPYEDLGRRFLEEYGGQPPSRKLFIGLGTVSFEAAESVPMKDLVEDLKFTPFRDPKVEKNRAVMLAELGSSQIAVKELQFGWECRDSVLSIEWQRTLGPNELCYLKFDGTGERREMRITVSEAFCMDYKTQNISIHLSQVIDTYLSRVSGESSITFILAVPPVYDAEPRPMYRSSRNRQRQRLSHFFNDSHHRMVAPYVGLAFRVILPSAKDLEIFKRLAGVAHLRNVQDYYYPVERRMLFLENTLSRVEDWLYKLGAWAWIVSFQVELLLRNNHMDPVELLSLKEHIHTCLSQRGSQYTADLLREFTEVLCTSWVAKKDLGDVVKLFHQVRRNRKSQTMSRLRLGQDEDNNFNCYHVTIRPSTVKLEGPVLERSNRVIRSYPQHEHCFLRVTFSDENDLQYRFDRDIDGPAFINIRVGNILRNGLTIGGKHFTFLAYSQSALKDHSVWFMTSFDQFIGDKLVRIDAPYVIEKLGYFKDLKFDPRLIYCPARYGARISQAFTATDASVTLEVEEIIHIPDIRNNGSCFTDGVGKLSSELAEEIWEVLSARRNRRLIKNKPQPRAFQIRFGGSKGVLSVDYSLKGRAFCIRPSMIKFESPNSLEIEIAQSFDKPGRMCLNRSLIILLEGLGVTPDVFLTFQRKAVRELKASVTTIDKTARLLEHYGLGVSFHLPAILKNLHKISVQLSTPEYSRMTDIAMNHILRELKHHARIPVPGWTLVGIADEHDYLEEDEVFICVQPIDGPREYLHGSVMISRSPAIHPGDVQMAYAIGPPPRNSPFEREQLQNTIVFSTRGSRSLPSCLGGGDLDGDLYSVTDHFDLHPKHTHLPASYDPAPRKELNRPSTMEDVADFVVDYINNDIVGIIATNWMIIADQSKKGILDPDCLLLAQLHSDAVDYPKSGNPVPISKVPKFKFQDRPDWIAPEIVTSPTNTYYKSERALGQLFRDIDLPQIKLSEKRSRNAQNGLSDTMSSRTLLSDAHIAVNIAVYNRVTTFIDIGKIDVEKKKMIHDTFVEFCSRLQSICRNCSLSSSRHSQLSEEEALIGTIVAKCAQPKRRKDLMIKLREQTGVLIEDTRDFIQSPDRYNSSITSLRGRLRTCWYAWDEARMGIHNGVFGAQSFWWISLGAIFDSIKAIESEEE